MVTIDARLSDAVAYGFSGGPEYLNDVVEMDNGREVRAARWLYPKHRYSARYPGLPKPAQAEILAVMHAARGRLYAFRFKDWNDFSATDQPLATAVGTSTPAQLVKAYTFGSQTTLRRIQAVVAGTLVVRDDSDGVVPVTLGAKGMVTPVSPWGAGPHTASFEFDVWVRLNSDYNAFVIGRPNGHTTSLELLEVFLP